MDMEQLRNAENKIKERSCPICLHAWNDPTVLDNCQHIFCFECIIEWTRIKPECPMCKTALQSLKHQILLNNNEVPSWDSEGGKIENIMDLRSEYEMSRIQKATSRPMENERHAIIQVLKSMAGEIHSLRSLSVTTYSSENIYRKAIADIDKEMTELKQLYHKISHGATRAELFKEPAFRRLVYKKNLMPNSICTPLFNVAFNPEYIRNNREAVRVHIFPYVIREIAAITKKDAFDIDAYLKQILDYLSSKTKRQIVVNFLSKRGIENPHHFLNNVLHFATAGQTLTVYDQNSEYTPRRNDYMSDFAEDDDVLVLNTNTHSNSDVQVIGERNTRSRQHRQMDNLPPNNFNNNIVLSDQYQQQPSTSSNSGDGNHGDNANSNQFASTSFRPIQSAIHHLMETFRQSQNQQSQQGNGTHTNPYFYTPPLPPPVGLRQHGNIRAGNGVEGNDEANENRSDHYNRRRQHENGAESPALVLDDSDDVEIVAEVKKRREIQLKDSDDDDDSCELELMDETE